VASTIARGLGRLLLGIAFAGLLGWAVLTVGFSPIAPEALRMPLAAAVAVAALAALIWLRPMRRAAAVIAVEFVVVLALFLNLEASNDRDWQPDVEKLPHADIDGDRVTVYNVRNADYRSETDYTVRYEDRVFDLAKLRSLDLFLIKWGAPGIAHSIMSWGFEGGEYLAISIETRKEVGETYSAVEGFFRQYELTYIVADERDVIRLRTNYRGEDVWVYRLDVPVEGPRQLLLGYLGAINRIYEHPEWYNALTENCTTTIQHLAAPMEQRDWWSWKLLVNGYLDELAYEIGAIDQSLPFEELRERSYVNERARAAGADANFSAAIRAGLPRMTSTRAGTEGR